MWNPQKHIFSLKIDNKCLILMVVAHRKSENGNIISHVK